MRIRTRLGLLAAIGCFGCGDVDDAPPLDETGTGGDEDRVLPGGAQCEANWFAIDGLTERYATAYGRDWFVEGIGR